jgi:cellulose synthase/poly-beta-1,6-N-acetylglucosamine synthase-like glycosyltransferase
VISPPTWEEAPVTLGAWLKQRTRWIKGHLHTWLILMRNPFRTAHEMGAAGFWSMQLTLGGGLAASFLHAPFACWVLWAMISPSNVLGLQGFILALCGYCTGLFSALTAAALARDLSHLRAIPTMPLYWTLSTIAAVRAFFELLFVPSYWAKTRHGLSPRPAHDSN